MSWRDLKRKVKQQLSELVEIPGDVMLDLPKLVMVGNVQLSIENHRGILEYTSEIVRVRVAEGEIAVDGANLMLRNILPGEIFLEGEIRSVSFIK